MNPSAAPRWILIIEDDRAFSAAIEESLKEKGFRTVNASYVSDALAKLRRQKFECILLDLKLERGGNGQEVIQQVRRDPKGFNYKTPIIVISGFLTKEFVLELGPTGIYILAKPFSPQDLMKRLDLALAGEST